MTFGQLEKRFVPEYLTALMEIGTTMEAMLQAALRTTRTTELMEVTLQAALRTSRTTELMEVTLQVAHRTKARVVDVRTLDMDVVGVGKRKTKVASNHAT